MWERVSEEVSLSECGLSCWLVLPAARKRRERMCALSCWLALSYCWPVEKREESEKWLARPFMLPRGGDLGRMASVILIGWKYATTITVKLIHAPNKNTKFFLLILRGLFYFHCPRITIIKVLLYGLLFLRGFKSTCSSVVWQVMKSLFFFFAQIVKHPTEMELWEILFQILLLH